MAEENKIGVMRVYDEDKNFLQSQELKEYLTYKHRIFAVEQADIIKAVVAELKEVMSKNIKK